jgi:hypothetical protein
MRKQPYIHATQETSRSEITEISNVDNGVQNYQRNNTVLSLQFGIFMDFMKYYASVCVFAYIQRKTDLVQVKHRQCLGKCIQCHCA